MDARRLRFGAMLAATLGVVGLALALALGASREGEQAGAQGAVPTTAPAAALPATPPTCTATTLGGSRTANAALAADCDTLLALETTLVGTGVGRRELNWAPGRALTSWKGVTVRGTPKRVAKLSLRGSGLTGAIPAQLGSLTALTELNLSWNRLSGAIPTQLGSLTKLRTLALSGNTLTGCVPNMLWNATTSDLHRLRLESCTVAVVVKGQEVGPGTYRLVRGSSALVFIVPAGLRMRYAYGGSVALCDQGPCNLALLFDIVNHDVSVCVDAVTGNDCSNGARLVKQNDGTWQWTRSTNRAGGASGQSHSVSPMVEELIGGFYASTRVERVP